MITPSRGYVLISPEQAESKTTDGLYLPDSGQDKPMKGTVIEVGGQKYSHIGDIRGEFIELNQLEYKKGDRVYFKKWSGDTIRDGDQELVFIKFEDILGIIE